MLKIAVMLLIASACALAQPAPEGPKSAAVASISGTITDAGTGEPMAEVTVAVTELDQHIQTDQRGRYSLRNVKPGQYRIVTITKAAPMDERAVTVRAGFDLSSIDFRLRSFGKVSGRVLDQNGAPLPGVTVVGLSCSYAAGQIRYAYDTSRASTNEKGEYVIDRVFPGLPIIVMAETTNGTSGPGRAAEAVSGAPADPRQRRPASIPTFYPDTVFPEGALPVTLRSGEQREGVDIHVRHWPSYCIDGVVLGPGGPGTLRFTVDWLPSKRRFPNSAGADARTGPDGKFRVCGLVAGEWGITASDIVARDGVPEVEASTVAALDGKDLHDLKVSTQAVPRVAGEVVIEGEVPEKPLDRAVSIAVGRDLTNRKTPIPGKFAARLSSTADSLVRVTGIPGGLYLKEVTYGGISFLHLPFRAGVASGDAKMRVVLARNGGTVSIKVADKDGNPVICNVFVIPDFSGSDAELSSRILAAQTDQTGAYVSPMLPPGKYHLLAATGPNLKYPTYVDTVARLRLNLVKAKDVDLSPNGTVQASLEPLAID